MLIVRESLDDNIHFTQGDNPYKNLSIGSHRSWNEGDEIKILEPIWVINGERLVKNDDMIKTHKFQPSIIKGDILIYTKPAALHFFYMRQTSRFVTLSLEWIEAHPNSYIRIKN